MSHSVQMVSGIRRSPSSSAVEGLAGDAAVAWKLNAVACRVGNRLEVDACAVYRFDRLRGTLTLVDAVGLRREAVGRACLGAGEGLPGLVAEHGRTLHVPERAASHPRFRLLSETGDEPYESFLGVPVCRRGAVTGVLAVQNAQPRRFRRKEVAWLESVGRRLGVLLATTVEPAAGPARSGAGRESSGGHQPGERGLKGGDAGSFASRLPCGLDGARQSVVLEPQRGGDHVLAAEELGERGVPATLGALTPAAREATLRRVSTTELDQEERT